MLRSLIQTGPARRHILALLGAGTAALLLVVLLALPRPLRVDVGTPGDTPFLAGFFAAERDDQGRTFRWSGLQSRLRLYGASSAPHRLTLRLNGDLRAQQINPRLFLRQGEQTLATLTPRPGWRTYHVLLPPGSLANAAGYPKPLALAIAPYCPESADNRVLGVPLARMEATPLETGARALSGPLLGALFAYGLWAIGYRLWARIEGQRVRGYWLLTIGYWLVVLLWAWLSPHTLAWLLSFAPWLVGIGAIGYGLWVIGKRLWAIDSRLPPIGYRLLVAAAVLLLGNVLLLAPLPIDWRGAGAWLVLLLPGALAGWLLFRDEPDPLLVGVLAWCGALALPVLLLLALHVLPGPPPGWVLLLLCNGLAVAMGYGLWVRGQRPGAPRTAHPSSLASGLLLLIVLLAAALRLPFLGNAEFQGDEARALLLAMNVQHGHDNILLYHRKGPVEVLLPAAPLVLTGLLNEGVARLPFALAGIGVVPGVYVLARRMLGPAEGVAVGLLAALLVAAEGFLVAFSRIVQYQSPLVLMGVGALLCAWRFAEGTPHPRRALLLAAGLAAVGMLSHYDGIYVLPALAWLTLWGGWRRGWRGGQWVRGLAPPLLLGAGLLLSFYLPFFTHEQFGGTLNYLTRRVDPANVPALLYNNLPGHYERATFYNTTLHTQVLASILAAGITAWLLRYGRPRWLGAALAGLWLLGCAVLLLAPAWFEVGRRLNWAVLAFGLPLAALVLFPATPAGLRTAVLWFAVPFGLLSFLIADPRTHYYAMNPAAALLAALAVVRLVAWLRSHPRRPVRLAQVPLALAGALALLLAVPYLFLAFVQQSPEYQRSFPVARPALYEDLASDRVPWDGIFGFPHRDGWKVVGELYRRGELQGTYDANQRDRMSIWYTRGEQQCADKPDYFFLVTWDGANLDEKMELEEHAPDYNVAACVLVEERRMMNIYTRAAVEAPPAVRWLHEYRAAFDAQPVPDFPMQGALNVSLPQYEADIAWTEGVRLAGYDLKRQRVEPGQFAPLTLYWDADAPLTGGYAPTLEVVDADGILMSDARPTCDLPPPAAWSPYYLNRAAFGVQAAAPLPPGTYTLRVSLRNPQTSHRLPLADGRTSAPLATLTVEEP
jgi:4-amino-4-deoxy-L-arabinose transferase-like glycosyltransferase